MIKYKCLVYNNLFIVLYDVLEAKKKKVDRYYITYQLINAYIQLSIIFLSILNSFFQALDVKLYNFLFNANIDDIQNSNTTNLTNYNSEEEVEFGTIKKSATLIIGMYTALFIGLDRHYKFQQKENNIEILKNGYSEPLSLVENNLQTLRPWMYKHYYLKSNNKKDHELDPENLDDDKVKEWVSFSIKIDKEYNHAIELKKNLDITYGKLINSNHKIESKIKAKDTLNDINYKHNLPQYKHKYHNTRSELRHIKKLVKKELEKEEQII